MKAMIQLFIALSIMACAGKGYAQWSRIDSQTIKLDGDIGNESYVEYLKVAKGGYSRVILDSSGGSPLPALLIAQDMRAHEPEVIVADRCFSACANYLLLAGPAPRVQCGALVIWHGSPSNDFASNVAVMEAQMKDPRLIETYGRWARKFTAMEDAFFASIHVDKKLLSDSVEIVRREHVAPKATFTFDEMSGDYSETVSSGLWIPTVDVIRSYGVDTARFCPTYDAEIPGALRRLGIRSPYTLRGP